jgi:WD40 repeat protein
VIGLAFLNGSEKVLVTCDDGQVWRVTLSTRTASSVLNEPAAVTCSAVSRDGKYVALGLAQDKQKQKAPIRIVDVNAGRVTGEIDLGDGRLRSVAFSPNGEHLVSTSFDGRVKVVDRLKMHCSVQIAHAQVRCAQFTSDGTKVISCADCDDATIKVWDARTGGLFHTRTAQSPFLTLTVGSDDSRIVTTHRDGAIRVWKLAD